MSTEEGPSGFFGKEGESVPEVDPDDIKAVWREHQSAAKDHPGEQVAIGIELLKHVCKPGADMRAVCYRSMHLGLLPLIARHTRSSEQEMAAFQDKVQAVIRGGELIDSAFDAVAKVPMIWAKRGLPYDFDEFLRLCAA